MRLSPGAKRRRRHDVRDASFGDVQQPRASIGAESPRGEASPGAHKPRARRPQFCQSRAENCLRHRHAPRAERAKGPSAPRAHRREIAERFDETRVSRRATPLGDGVDDAIPPPSQFRHFEKSTHRLSVPKRVHPRRERVEVRATEHATHQPIRLSRASSPRASITHEPRPPVERATRPRERHSRRRATRQPENATRRAREGSPLVKNTLARRSVASRGDSDEPFRGDARSRLVPSRVVGDFDPRGEGARDYQSREPSRDDSERLPPSFGVARREFPRVERGRDVSSVPSLEEFVQPVPKPSIASNDVAVRVKRLSAKTKSHATHQTRLARDSNRLQTRVRLARGVGGEVVRGVARATRRRLRRDARPLEKRRRESFSAESIRRASRESPRRRGRACVRSPPRERVRGGVHDAPKRHLFHASSRDGRLLRRESPRGDVRKRAAKIPPLLEPRQSIRDDARATFVARGRAPRVKRDATRRHSRSSPRRVDAFRAKRVRVEDSFGRVAPRAIRRRDASTTQDAIGERARRPTNRAPRDVPFPTRHRAELRVRAPRLLEHGPYF